MVQNTPSSSTKPSTPSTTAMPTPGEVTSTLSSEELNSGLGNQTLLDKIDRLFACGVGSYIDLPQLVVVGDQSSGKSSVLEALTGLPFPRSSGLCTRFATQIVFRRSSTERITVSIMADKDASKEHQAIVKSWQKTDLKNLDADAFSSIMEEATRVMGITAKDEKPVNGKSTFSKDVLKLELTGPRREHLSIIDVPGIFKNTSDNATTKADIELVKEMVLSYMRNSRSLMLTVLPANVDPATQEILLHAHDVDPNGTRTLGVLTKPDRVEVGCEGAVLDMLNRKTHVLAHGWHVLRNAAQAELGQTIEQRNAVEDKFFQETHPWTSIDPSNAGVESLRLRLQELLATHTKHEFPKVRAELQKRLAECQKHLEDLGASRDNSAEQLKYLHGVATRFEALTTSALKTDYANDDVFDKIPSLKLATIVRNRDEKFSKMLQRMGHTYAFLDVNGEAAFASDDIQERMKVADRKDVPVVQEIIGNRKLLVHCADADGVWQWLEELYIASRGLEIGTFQPTILSNAMKMQSVNWDDIALGYINDILSAVHEYITKALEHICPDTRVRDALMLAMEDELVRRYRKAIAQVDFLLHVERKEIPFTVADDFAHALEERRTDRERIKEDDDPVIFGGTATHGFGAKPKSVPSPPKPNPVPPAQEDKRLTNREYLVNEIHDILAAYYETARQRFADCVINHAGHFFGVIGSESPLKVLSSGFVVGLTDQQREEIAGEEPSRRHRRKVLMKQLEDLEAGRKVLRT